MTSKTVHIIGAGMAGSEAAWQVASAGIPVVLLMGSDEKTRSTATLKHLVKGEQVEVPLAELAVRTKALLEG